jgi:hypothetical protein
MAGDWLEDSSDDDAPPQRRYSAGVQRRVIYAAPLPPDGRARSRTARHGSCALTGHGLVACRAAGGDDDLWADSDDEGGMARAYAPCIPLSLRPARPRVPRALLHSPAAQNALSAGFAAKAHAWHVRGCSADTFNASTNRQGQQGLLPGRRARKCPCGTKNRRK